MGSRSSNHEISDLHAVSTATCQEVPAFFNQGGVKSGSRPVSRVLSWAIIPLGCASPRTSSSLPGSTRGPRAAACAACFPIWPCSRRGLPCRLRCRRRGALLPHHFNLAVTLSRAWAVSFLLHFPWAYAPQALPGAAPYGARTFLHALADAAIAWPTPGHTLVPREPELKGTHPFNRGRVVRRHSPLFKGVRPL